MADINFPDSPTNGQVHTIGDTEYTYNSAKGVWNLTQLEQYGPNSDRELQSLGVGTTPGAAGTVTATGNVSAGTMKLTTTGIVFPDATSQTTKGEVVLNTDQKRKITISTSSASGGSDGDIWIKV